MTDWQRIAEDIKGNYDKYDGFVILHSTDTMSFTASALSFMLEDLHKPVIITGSQIPLAELRSDGQQNAASLWCRLCRQCRCSVPTTVMYR